MVAGKSGAYPSEEVLQSRVGSRLHPQTLDSAGKACQGQTLAYYEKA
jgi:hypothetical protein